MSFLASIKEKIFGRRRREIDPLRALGIDLWQHEWIRERLDFIYNNLNETGNYVEACDRLNVVIRVVCEPWFRSDKELAQKVAAWDQAHKYLKTLYNILKSAGKVCEEEYVLKDDSGKVVGKKTVLEGQAAEYVNRLALDVFKMGLHLLTLAWKKEDVGPANVFLIQKLYPEMVPAIRPTAEMGAGKREHKPLPPELEQ